MKYLITLALLCICHSLGAQQIFSIVPIKGNVNSATANDTKEFVQQYLEDSLKKIDEKSAREALQEGANINKILVINGVNKGSYLHVAVENKNAQLIELLLNLDIKQTMLDVNGYTAESLAKVIACRAYNAQVFDLIKIQKEASTQVANNDGKACAAVTHKSFAIVDIFENHRKKQIKHFYKIFNETSS